MQVGNHDPSQCRAGSAQNCRGFGYAPNLEVQPLRTESACARHAVECVACSALCISVLLLTLTYFIWVAVKKLKLSHYIRESTLITMYTHHGNLI